VLESLLHLLAGLVLIVKGGDWFVGAAIRIATFLRMPRVVVGSTIVSLATTMPELVVSLMAGAQGEPGLAMGNAVGSCICNIGLILGVAAIIRAIPLRPADLARPLGVMLGVSLLLFVATLDLRLGRPTAFVLITIGVSYFAWDFAFHLRRRDPVEKLEAAEVIATAQRRFVWLETRFGTASQFIGAAAVVIIGSHFLVKGAVAVALALGIAPLIVGLTVVAIGTSLPELITAITSSRKGASDLGVGNVLGANIANLTFIVGVAALQTEVSLSRSTHFFHFPVMLALMGWVLWRLARDRRISRFDGALLLGVFAVYLIVVGVDAASG
jgi:cation:H+ antiporter